MLKNEGKHDMLMVKKGKPFKRSGKKKGYKGKGKKTFSPKPKATKGDKKKKIVSFPSDSECFYCKKKGHWKRYCLKLKEDKKNDTVASRSSIYVIDLNIARNASWVFDTKCGSHLCSNSQGLRKSRNLAKGQVQLQVNNGARIAAVSVGTLGLSLPSGLFLELDECYHVPNITKNSISISALDAKGF
ncbi:uncharacterized protein LOC110682870 [Chenopodium quinoa]|uniref:uncharacterized protein LOC110682870 n=1 Tax=Chenopodium quinoa TaxID=63459 RepID=UPI000B7933D3|nr:uncharacterized protein LOC110682870 [Chenopodium quinoa]